MPLPQMQKAVEMAAIFLYNKQQNEGRIPQAAFGGCFLPQRS
jgi:hypothetical protein